MAIKVKKNDSIPVEHQHLTQSPQLYEANLSKVLESLDPGLPTDHQQN